MGRFNLLYEPWIEVYSNEAEKKKKISMLELFQDAGSYRCLAGEMETQNFAVLRFLLSIVQTVFSRFDIDGSTLPGVTLDEKWRQEESVDEDDIDDYCTAAEGCWQKLYKSGRFPKIVFEYLEKWRNHFFLFDEEHPFFQVSHTEMDETMFKISNKRKPTTIYGKNLNRTISESENKEALFSPVANCGSEKRGRKDILTEAELARWLLTFQGYSGLADKVSLTTEGQRPSKGWLFDLGGICLEGKNLFETLVMNYIPYLSDNQRFIGRIQKPCWEYDGREVVNRICAESFIDNLSELYTNWGRAVWIDPGVDMSKPAEIQIVKLPEIEHCEYSIEPMTLWRKNEDGPNKGHFTPKKHRAEEALWRSFGLMTMKTSSDGDSQRQPGIFCQYKRLQNTAGSRWTNIIGISMEDDGNSTSWLPVDEVTDSFQINNIVMTDDDSDGWIIRINEAVNTTKDVISHIFRGYLRGICEIRNLKLSKPIDPAAEGFLTDETARMYTTIDLPFKNWLASISPGVSKDAKINEWYAWLRKTVLERGKELFENSTERDLKGIKTERGTENIATKYLQFLYRIDNRIGGNSI